MINKTHKKNNCSKQNQKYLFTLLKVKRGTTHTTNPTTFSSSEISLSAKNDIRYVKLQFKKIVNLEDQNFISSSSVLKIEINITVNQIIQK